MSASSLSDKQLNACIAASERIIKSCIAGLKQLAKVRLDDGPMRQVQQHYEGELDGLITERMRRAEQALDDLH
jgi:hypothetical protein